MITNLNPYPAYKPSGVEWLGDVPEHWEVRRLANCLQSLDSGSREQIELDSENGISNLGGEHIGRDGQLLLRNMRYISRRFFQSLRKGVVKENDILLVKDGATIGKVAIVRVLPHSECTVNEHVFILRSANDCLSGFIYNNIRSQGVQELIWQLVTGSAQPGLNSTFIKNVHIPLPPLPEQAAIVRFLDYVDRRIRRYIRAKQKLIKLLEEYRQAIIHRAVTGQIDVRTGKPYPAYKPSGVPWLGDVPEHWEVVRLKHVCRLAYGDALISETRQEGSVPVYGSNGQVGWHSAPNTKSPCIVIGRKGSFGKVNFSSEPVFAIDTTFFVDSRTTRANIRWMYFLLSWLRLDEVSKDSAVPGLDREDAYQRIVVVPTFSEQSAIVEYLDAQTAKIDTAIDAARREIELLREYRTRLIADVVTGKLDVREVASRLPEEPPEDEREFVDEEATSEDAATDEAAAESVSEEEVES